MKRNGEKKSGFNEECEEKWWREMEKKKSGFNEECEEKWWREMEKKNQGLTKNVKRNDEEKWRKRIRV